MAVMLADDVVEIAKIGAVAPASCTAIGLVGGFYEGREAGFRAFWYSLPLAGLFATLQVVEASYAPLVVASFVGVAVFVHRRLRR